MKNIIGFFAREHLFGNLLTILILVFGLISVFTIRRDIWPKVNLHVTTVQTVLPGASPEQVEKLVINPLESAIKEVDGLKEVISTSTENTGVIVLKLDPDSRDTERTNSDLQRVIDRVDDLPEDAEKPVVTIIDSGIIPIIEVTVAGHQNEMETRSTAKKLADEISLMSGVARVVKQGYRKREYLVEADPQKLASRNVPLQSLINSINLRNITMPGGSIVGPAGIERLVRTEAQYDSPESLKNTYIVANESGFGSRLGDVAAVKETLAKPEKLYRSNGEESVNMIISKKENYDVLKLVKEIREKIATYSSRLGDSIKLGVSNDFSFYLQTRLNALGSNLFIGLFLVLIILTLFLPWQVTIVVAIGIPIALLSAILAIQMAGLSLNLISLMGLIIVLGMLVDDAIVVSENIWRHIEEGNDIMKAVIDGASEVFVPVLASILTTVSAFGPMLFMTGIFGAFVFEIPMMVILALALSMFEVFVIMPSHFSSWVGPFVVNIKEKKKKKAHWFDRVAKRYGKYVSWSLNHRYGVLAMISLIFIGSVGLMAATGRFVLFPADDVELFFVQVEAPEGVSLQEMSEKIQPIEKQLFEYIPKSDLLDIVSQIGIIQQDMMDPLTRRGSHYANIRVTLTAQSERARTANQIIATLREKIVKPEGLRKINYELVQNGPPQGRTISMNIRGEKFEVLKEMADEFKTRLAKIDGVVDIRDSFQMGKEEWKVVPKYNEASFGLNASVIATNVRAAFDGVVASSIRLLDEEIDIRVKLRKFGNSIQEQLKSLKVGNNQGNLVDLTAVADFEKSQSLSSISHQDYKRVVNVSAGVDETKITGLEVNQLIRPILDDILKNQNGYDYHSGGEDKDTQESMQSLMVAFLFAACFIFSLLIVTFKNVMQPILILTSIPMGFIGVIWAMFLHGLPFSFMSMLGVIALAGVIVNNSIVFLDFVNRQRSLGENLNSSIINTAVIRLRPIVLTTVTTICGLLPTAYGDKIKLILGFGGGDPFVIPIALALGWGLAIGSLMTGLFFPAFIRILDDITHGLLPRLGRIVGLKKAL